MNEITTPGTVNNIINILKDEYSQQLTNLEKSVFSNKVLTCIIQNKSNFELVMVELLRFFYIKSHINDDISPSGLIDEVWHILLQYPKFYYIVCSLIAKQDKNLKKNGNISIDLDTIIDHNPLGAHDDQLVARQKRYVLTLRLLKNTFNDQHVFPAAWPPTNHGDGNDVIIEEEQQEDNIGHGRKRRKCEREKPNARIEIQNSSNSEPTGKNRIQIFVRGLTGKTFTVINVALSDTVHDVKAMIEDVGGMPIDLQRLTYQGKQLELGRTLDEYNVQDNSVFDLMLRMRGC